MTEKPLHLNSVSHTKSCPRSSKFFKNGINKLKKYILTPYLFYGVRLQWLHLLEVLPRKPQENSKVG